MIPYHLLMRFLLRKSLPCISRQVPILRSANLIASSVRKMKKISCSPIFCVRVPVCSHILIVKSPTRGNIPYALPALSRPKFPLFNFYLGSFTERLDSNFSMIIGYSNEFFCHSLSKGLKYSPVPLDLPERYIVPRPLLFWIPCIPISTVYP